MKNDKKFTGAPQPAYMLDVVGENNQAYMLFVTRALYKCLAIVLGLLFLSLAGNAYFFYRGVNPKIIALTQDMRVVDLAPLDKPLVSSAGLLSWYQQTLSDTFTFSFADWRKRLGAVKDRYSSSAFTAITEGFRGPLSEIEEKRNSVVSVLPEPPRILSAQLIDGVYTWIVEARLLISIEGASSRNTMNLVAKAYVIRANPAEVPSGIIIDKLILQPA